MKSVFVDASAFYSVLVAQDPEHARCLRLFETAQEENWTLVTTNLVVAETYPLLLNRSRGGRPAALGFLELVKEDGYQVEWVTPDDYERAVDILRSHTDKTYSVCDATSFVVTERLAIQEAIAFDRDFRQYGKLVLL